MGRPKKYATDRALRRAVEDYFDSISRVRVVMEERRTGARDKYGHFENEWVPVLDRRGQTMTQREFVLPPTVGGLCAHLDISRETWAQYCGLPQFAGTTAWAREQLQLYLEQQLLSREGKNLQGVIFSLQNNYGMSEKRTVELGERAAMAVRQTGSAERDAILRRLKEETDGLADGSAGEAGTAGQGGAGTVRHQ